jgi:hypothetical protein
MPALARSTTPGFSNESGQVVVRGTGARSVMRAGQRVYRLRCTHCQLEYGTAGIDVKDRRCPGCQGGAAGEALRDEERGPGLFV